MSRRKSKLPKPPKLPKSKKGNRKRRLAVAGAGAVIVVLTGPAIKQLKKLGLLNDGTLNAAKTKVKKAAGTVQDKLPPHNNDNEPKARP